MKLRILQLSDGASSNPPRERSCATTHTKSIENCSSWQSSSTFRDWEGEHERELRFPPPREAEPPLEDVLDGDRESLDRWDVPSYDSPPEDATLFQTLLEWVRGLERRSYTGERERKQRGGLNVHGKTFRPKESKQHDGTVMPTLKHMKCHLKRKDKRCSCTNLSGTL